MPTNSYVNLKDLIDKTTYKKPKLTLSQIFYGIMKPNKIKSTKPTKPSKNG
tara:strand:- start:241 stop:393 length:153 start_codon:yes stop_codon:yes gene_type:complete